jgi:hypothetical protein
MLIVVMLSFIYAECCILAHFAVCHYAEFHYAECRSTTLPLKLQEPFSRPTVEPTLEWSTRKVLHSVRLRALPANI